jgi:glycosyltransferase involved in cell wall biosynthesis
MGIKIAMISPFFVRCGISSYTAALSKALADLGCEVFGIRWPRFGLRTPELVQNILDKIPADIDLIHHQCEYGLLTPNLEGILYSGLRRLGKPIVTTVHAVGSFVADKLIGETSDRVIVHNEYCARHFQGDQKKVVIIPHGCSPVECPPAEECKRSLGIDPRIPVVGYVGFISPNKGLEVLIEVMRGVPNAALLIGGGWFVGDETQYIMQLKQWSLEVLPGRCQWLGYVPDERLPTVFGAMDVFVYPARVATESGALLMGLSHGRATIASSVPPFKEKEGRGALLTFLSADDLRAKILSLLSNEKERRRLEEGARRYAAENSWMEVAKRHKSLYEEVISERSERAS